MTRKKNKSRSKKAGWKAVGRIQDPQPEKPRVGLFVTKELNNAIEACQAAVERIAKDCRAKNRKFRDNEFDIDFDGSLCLHGYTERADEEGKDVQRVTEIFDDPHFFPPKGAASSNAIRQGSLGDCYFLSALATVSCIPGLIEKICVARDEQVGVYGFIFYRDTGWTSVIIDDMLFTNVPKYEELEQSSKELYHEDKERYDAMARKGGSILLYAKSGSQGETWVPLIEKAYAKFYGNFAHLVGGYTHEAIEDLTGAVSTAIITKDILDVDQFWREELLKANTDRLFACGFDRLDAPDDDPAGKAPVVQGLYSNHAYAVLRAVECRGKRFVVIRNPWGNGEWTGAWSDGSKEWTPQWLDILPELGHSFGDDGQFVMEYKDFLKCFNTIQRAFLFDHSWVVASDWLSVPVSSEPRVGSYGTLSFSISIPTKTKTIIVLSRLNDRFFRSVQKSLTLITLDFALVRVGETVPIETASETRPFSCRTVNLEIELDAGEYVVYVRLSQERTLSEYSGGEYVNSTSRVISRILSHKVECQSIARNWNNKAKSMFIAKSLEKAIADDLLELQNKKAEEEQNDAAHDGDDAHHDDDKETKEDEESGDKKESDEKKEVEEDNEEKGSLGSEPLLKRDEPETDSKEAEIGVGSFGDPPSLKKPSDTPVLDTVTWHILLAIITIGAANLLSLFGFTLRDALEQSQQSSNNEEHHSTPAQDSDASDDAASVSGSVSGSVVGSVVGSGEEYVRPETPVPMDAGDSGDWRDLLNDSGGEVILGLRVYTQTKEPAHVMGRIKDNSSSI